MWRYRIGGLLIGCAALLAAAPAHAQFHFDFGGGGFGIDLGGHHGGHHYSHHGYFGHDYGHHYNYGHHYDYGHHDYGHYDHHPHWGVIFDLYAPRRANTYIDRTIIVDQTDISLDYSRPPVPTDDQLQGISWRELRAVLRYGSEQFTAELDRLKTGDGWKKHFRLDKQTGLVADDIDAPPSAGDRDALLAIQQRYNKVAANQQYKSIQRMWGFQTVHIALGEYLKPIELRQRTRLAQSARQLDSALDQWSVGHTWQIYLALPDEIIADAETPAAPRETEPQVDPLQKVLGRFDKISHDPQYQEIAGLRQFKATHQLLAEYAAQQIPPPVGSEGDVETAGE